MLILGSLVMFQANAHVNLTNPIGGEVFYSGSTVEVSWVEVVAHTTLNWDLLFSEDGGLSWDTVMADIPLEERSYQWTVPAVLTTKAQIKIVQDNVSTDYDGISPNFGILFVTGISKPVNAVQMNVYPNPMRDFTSIAFNNPLHIRHRLSIYNTQGKVVISLDNITSEEVKIERGNLTAGLYLIRLRDEHEIRAEGKLLIE